MSTEPKFYSEDVKSIKSVDFKIFTNKEVKSYSAVSNDPFGINLAESYENYEPKKGGLVDLRLGSCDIYLLCTTCGLNSLDCVGHMGHTELAQPLFHYGFLIYFNMDVTYYFRNYIKIQDAIANVFGILDLIIIFLSYSFFFTFLCIS